MYIPATGIDHSSTWNGSISILSQPSDMFHCDSLLLMHRKACIFISKSVMCRGPGSSGSTCVDGKIIDVIQKQGAWLSIKKESDAGDAANSSDIISTKIISSFAIFFKDILFVKRDGCVRELRDGAAADRQELFHHIDDENKIRNENWPIEESGNRSDDGLYSMKRHLYGVWNMENKSVTLLIPKRKMNERNRVTLKSIIFKLELSEISLMLRL